MQKKFTVEGMSCSACSASVERAVGRLEGVSRASVDLLSKTLVCDFDEKKIDDVRIILAVSKAGFSASVKTEEAPSAPSGVSGLIASLGLLLLLMYISMGHMLSLPEIPFLKEALPFATAQFIITIPIIIINRRFFINGARALFRHSPNMDTLVSLGSLAGELYGIFAIFMIAFGNDAYRHNLYFESSAMILTLVSLGKFFESRSKDKTGDALRGLERLSPERATVVREGKEKEILTSEIVEGDIIVVKPGGRVAVDGVIVEGRAFFDTSALTGESLPVEKGEGDEVASSALSLDGAVKIRATSVGKNTTLSKIIDLVELAGATKAPIARLADKISGVFVPTVMALSLLTLIVWLLLGEGFEFSLSRALSVLVISCPCALGLATPVAITVAVGKLGSEGILVKSASFAEAIAKVKTVVFDKTGTVTEGKMALTDIYFEGDEKFFLSLIKALEAPSSHPLAEAVLEYTEKEAPLLIEDFKSVSGRGVEGIYDGKTALGGSLRFMKERGVELGELEEKAKGFSENGRTASFFALDGKALGVVGISDKVKSDAPSTVSGLKKLGIRTVLLTGDNASTARAVGDAVGFDEVIAEVLPEDKERVVRKYCEKGTTVMVGDGINDSPALAASDVGIAVGSGTDIAIDASDVILMSKGLSGVLRTVTYSKAVFRNIKQNLFWAFFYNTLGIPLAAGVFYFAGILLSPMIAAAAMSFSSVFVITNALRLYRK